MDAPLPLTVKIRHLQIVGLLRDGLTDREIGNRLGLSPRTVSNNLAHLYALTGVPSRAHLVSLFERGHLTLGGDSVTITSAWRSRGLARTIDGFLCAEALPLVASGFTADGRADQLQWILDHPKIVQLGPIRDDAFRYAQTSASVALQTMAGLRKWIVVRPDGEAFSALRRLLEGIALPSPIAVVEWVDTYEDGLTLASELDASVPDP
jgi:DNA-binding CsgD family transcriptional regulator